MYRGRNITIKSLKQGSLIRIKGKRPFDSHGVYHVFIVLNADLSEDIELLLVNGTTKGKKRIDYYNKLKIPPSEHPLVFIEAGKYHFFSKDTWIDCNSISHLNLYKIDDCEIMPVKGRLEDDDFQSIIRIIAASKLISPHYKQMIGIDQSNH